MVLRPALFLATLLFCAHLNEGRIIIRLSSLLGSKQSSSSLTDGLRSWLDAHSEDGAPQEADDGVSNGSYDSEVKDDVDNKDLLLWSIINKFKEYTNKYNQPAEPEQSTGPEQPAEPEQPADPEQPVESKPEKTPVKPIEAPIGGGGKEQVGGDPPKETTVKTTAVPEFPVSLP